MTKETIEFELSLKKSFPEGFVPFITFAMLVTEDNEDNELLARTAHPTLPMDECIRMVEIWIKEYRIQQKEESDKNGT